MRPIKLTISAFGPYANKQIIDFEELNGRNIFVISGKTGAGKTTIFDAISYALYGEASGESRETDSLRSHFADDNIETFVELEFELRGERYIINRVPKQKKKKARGEGYTEKSADATLTLPDGKVITKVTNVSNKIIELLGINRDQFKQIVMLAQGEFKKLLLADSVEREGIFRKIFNTYDFEKIQIELKEKALSLSKNRNKSKDKINTYLENIKGEHDIVIGEYVDFNFIIEKLKDFIENDSKNYKDIEEENTKISNKLDNLSKEKITIENNNNLLEEKELIRKELENLLSKEEEFKNKKTDIVNIKNAKEIKYVEDKLIDNKFKLLKKEEEHKTSLSNIEKIKECSELVKENLKIEENKESERDTLKVEIEKLKNIEPKLTELDLLKNKNIDFSKSIEEIKLKILNNKKLNESLKNEKIENENILKEISSLETKKVELENEKQNKTKAREEMITLYNIIKEYERCGLNHYNLFNEYKEFEKDYSKIKNDFEGMDDLYKYEQAGILASRLEKGMPCPVCGSTNHPNPTSIKNNANVPTKEELDNAKKKFSEAENEKNKKINDLTRLNESIKNQLDNVNNSLDKFSKDLNIDKTYSQSTSMEVVAKGKELRSIIDKLGEDLEKINKKISLKESIAKKITEIEEKVIKNEKAQVELEERERKYIEEFAKVNTKIEEYKKDIPENIADLQSLKDMLNTKVKTLNSSIEKLNKLRKENDDISKKLEGEISTCKEIDKTIKELNLEISKIDAGFKNLIKNCGFEDLKIYEDAKIKINQVEYLEKQVENYNSNLKLYNSRKEDIINKTKELKVVDLSTIEEEIKNLKEKKKEIEEKLRNTFSIIENNKNVLKNVEKLNIEFKEMEEEYKIVGELADLANGRKSPYISFERYILASYFEDIIEASNIRLEKMTGDRFSLIRKKSKSKGAGQKGLELEIYDNYTDSSRDVSSLSGGESFKASLSLALGLSDVVQSNAGGVSLDTMFVDEGFGTLDPQSLDNAIDSLLELQRGGRLVGIISHVEELKERIDAKLEVVSTSKGSKAEFVII